MAEIKVAPAPPDRQAVPTWTDEEVASLLIAQASILEVLPKDDPAAQLWRRRRAEFLEAFYGGSRGPRPLDRPRARLQALAEMTRQAWQRSA